MPKQDNDGSDAREIGHMPLRMLVTAMVVGWDGQAFSYAKAIPISVAMAWRFVEDSKSAGFSWWRLEIKVDAANGQIKRGDEAVVAEHPYANGWTHLAVFKPASKKGSVDRLDIATSPFASLSDAVQFSESSSFDLWEKGKYLTAGVSQPELPFAPSETVRNIQKNGLYVFGACNNAHDVEDRLVQDPAVQQLIRATERGPLRFWAPSAKLNQIPRLLDEVKDERWGLMSISIRQALAGPHCDEERWIYRPVTDKIEQIYKGHVNRLNRKLTDEQSRLSTFEENDFGNDNGGS